MKKIKVILPALAILVAMAATLVTNANSAVASYDVSNSNSSPCATRGTCVEGGSVTCAVDSQIYSNLYKKSDCSTDVTNVLADFQ
jgi:hypothetical protein